MNYIDLNGEMVSPKTENMAYIQTNNRIRLLEERHETAIENIRQTINRTAGEIDLRINNESNTLNGRITSEISTVNSRFDNIIAYNNDTDGNSELLDMRVGTDGTVYESAGTAVRKQIENTEDLVLNNPFSKPVKNLYNDWFNDQENLSFTKTAHSTYGVATFMTISNIYSDGINWESGHYTGFIKFNITDMTSAGGTTPTVRLKIYDGHNNATNFDHLKTLDNGTGVYTIIDTVDYTQNDGLKACLALAFGNLQPDSDINITIQEIGLMKSDEITNDIITHYGQQTVYPVFDFPPDYFKSLVQIDSKIQEATAPISAAATDYSICNQAYIRKGQLICNLDSPSSNTDVVAKYTVADIGELPLDVICSARFYGNHDTTVALISEPNGLVKKGVTAVTNGSVHITFSSDGHISAGYFDNQVLTNKSTITFPPLNTDGSTEYKFGYRVLPNAIRIWKPVPVNEWSATANYEDVFGNEFYAHHGRYVIWEHFIQNASTHQGYPAFTEFLVRSTNNANTLLVDDFQRPDGAVGISPQGYIYAQFNNNNFQS